MSSFIAKAEDALSQCPRCSLDIDEGQRVNLLWADWPYDPTLHPENDTLWHWPCATAATAEARCPECSGYHRDHGMCLI